MALTERFHELTLEDVIGDRFGRYSKYIIQDRAIPDARDGLKPVQRRILYAMYREGNTHDKPFRKSAKTVGNVIGNYHPHGDSSVYEAMVRLSQDWKARYPLIEMHGNNGSIDGDPPAAMRYTEARLSALAIEMLKDIDKQTVDFVPNFDDQDVEPTVLPAKLPNLLVNGATGISAGYATDIPPHNLAEVLDGVLMRLDRPDCTVDDLMTVIKGPDFPTGAIIEGIDGIKKAYETGKGKIIIRSKATIEPIRGGKEQIVITEIPYDVNKALLVKKIDEMRFDKRLEGIADVRDESDRTVGLRIVIELKKDVDGEAILNYLYKNTDLQITYNFNMIAIHNRRPTMMTLPLMLDAYIDHQKDVVTRRTKYDLQKAKDRLHIVEGLIKALSILDDVIQTIRSSKDKKDAKNNLQVKFQFTEQQAEAIVNLQLYRLTNTDITQLQKEHEELQKTTEKLTKILSSEKELIKVIKKEILELRKQFAEPRLSTIQAEIKEIKVSLDVLIPSEDFVVTVTKDGYVKRTSLRSYAASSPEDIAMKESDYLLYENTLNTQHFLLIFTNKGNYIFQPVHELPEIRWKDLGQHISSIVPIEEGEKVVGAVGVENFEDENLFILTATKQGQVKLSKLNEYQVTRYSKPIKTMNLKNDDEMIYANLVTPGKEIILTSYLSYTVRFDIEEIPVTGIKTGGVKGINLKDEDFLAAVNVIEENSEKDVIVVTQRGAIKRMSLSEIEQTGRAKRGLVILKELKKNPHRIFDVSVVHQDDTIVMSTIKQVQETMAVSDLPISDRYSNGSLKFDVNSDGDLLFVKILHPEQDENKEQ
ncbi:MAG: DNA topoisomerase IV subunit A [Bacilli bacterium]|uniref:DNA topoisomerase IV subunit A n=1 Tax=Ureibacillus sp. FSL W7-1570 TaxID=2954593 RepID=UPI001EB8DA51|nr:DNA topoisomerase IV subunit A [Bacilli bacterium]